MQLQPPPLQETGDACAPLRQRGRIVMEQREIIDVAQIRRAQHFRDEMVASVEIEIGEDLAGEVADREAAPPLEGREQVLAGEMQIDRLLRVGAINDQIHQPQHAFASDAVAEFGLQAVMIDGREIAEDVAAQHERLAIAIVLISCDRFVRASACAFRRSRPPFLIEVGHPF